MLKALDRDSHAQRLRLLMQGFRAQELSMKVALHDLQAQLEHAHRQTTMLRLESRTPGQDQMLRCTELQTECEELATELVHVRLAIAGAAEELADHQGRLLHAG